MYTHYKLLLVCERRKERQDNVCANEKEKKFLEIS